MEDNNIFDISQLDDNLEENTDENTEDTENNEKVENDKPVKAKRKTSPPLTDEKHVEWMIINYTKYSNEEELAKALSNQFGIPRTKNQVEKRVRDSRKECKEFFEQQMIAAIDSLNTLDELKSIISNKRVEGVDISEEVEKKLILKWNIFHILLPKKTAIKKKSLDKQAVERGLAEHLGI